MEPGPAGLFVCELCNITIYNEQSRESHILGKKHKLALHKEHMSQLKESRGIFVTGFPNLLPHEELLNVFAKYGKIIEHHFSKDNRFLIVQFDSEQPVEKLLQTKIVLRGKGLNIKKRVLRGRDGGPPHVTAPSDDFEEINQNLKDLPDFATQVKTLLQKIQPNFVEYVPKYRLLCADLQKVLRDIFPNCVVYPFGSTVTGLCFKNSDVDIFVQTFNIEEQVPGNVLQYSRATTYVNKSKHLLYKYNNIFSQILAIPTAKTPIIKCVHNSTNINCDFNFKSMLGVCNSSLIRYYLSLDDKLPTFMMVIKYWAKVHELSGSTGRFSNYALILMVIFYLQQDPYSLLPVTKLQTAACENIQEKWNGGFAPAVFESKILKHHTVPQLLHGFFEYYSNFDFSVNVICPLVGEAVQRTDFLKPELLPEALDRYKNNIKEQQPLKVESPVCVQDPFELNHNTVNAVPSRILEEFIALCKLGSELFKHSPDNLTLYKLFNDEADCLDSKKFILSENESKFKIPMSCSLLHLNEIVTSSSESSNAEERLVQLRTAWFDLVNKFIISVLCNVMRFNVNVLQESLDTKSQKLNGQDDIHDVSVLETVSFRCSGVYNLWEARKSISKDIVLDESLSSLDKQIALTNYICNVLYKNLNLNEMILEFILEMEAKLNPTEMIFRIKNVKSRKESFRSFALSFSKNVPLWFEKYISDLDKKVKLENKEKESVKEEDVSDENT